MDVCIYSPASRVGYICFLRTLCIVAKTGWLRDRASREILCGRSRTSGTPVAILSKKSHRIKSTYQKRGTIKPK